MKPKLIILTESSWWDTDVTIIPHLLEKFTLINLFRLLLSVVTTQRLIKWSRGIVESTSSFVLFKLQIPKFFKLSDVPPLIHYHVVSATYQKPFCSQTEPLPDYLLPS